MNDFVSKLKTFDYKGFALKHGEKLGLSLVILFTLMALYRTSWGSFEKSPQELVDQASKAMHALTTMGWPDEEKQQFQVVDLEKRAKEQELAMSSNKYNYNQVFTPPLYPRMQPAERPTMLPLQLAIVNDGNFPAPMHPPASTEKAPGEKPGATDSSPESESTSEEFNPELTGPAKPVVAGPAVKDPTDRGFGDPASDEDAQRMRRRARQQGMEEGGRGPARGREPGGLGMDAPQAVAKVPEVSIPGRGLRYVSFRALFPFERQAQLMAEALHHAGVRRGAEDVVFWDFEIQRRRLTKKDPETWSPWEKLEYEPALSLLEEIADYAPDVVRTEVTDTVITMPLPKRLRGQWHWLTAGHPVLKEYLLKKDAEIQKELETNRAVLETTNKLKLNAPKAKRRPGQGTPRGYTNYVTDMPNLYRNLNDAMMNNPRASGEFRDRMAMRNRAMLNTNPGGDFAAPGFGNVRTGNNSNQGLAAITGFDPFAVPKWKLFRYLDFTVEPGNCYSYRVRLEFINPNYQKALDKVVSADVAQGETLKSDWSEPSPPIYVEPDVDIFLAHVPRHQNALREGARLNVIEWDPRFGTNVTATMMKHFFGQVVGGPTKTEVVDPFSRSWTERDISIRTKEVFLDSKTIPPMILNDNSDLGLGKDQWARLEDSGAFEQAVTVNSAAELESHVPIAESARQKKAMKDTATERAGFSEFKPQAPAADARASSGDALSRDMAAEKSQRQKGAARGPRNAAQSGTTALNPLKPTGQPGSRGRGRNGQRGGGGPAGGGPGGGGVGGASGRKF